MDGLYVMTMAKTATCAREVLEYCRYALEELRQNASERQWIVRWVAALALLRTVDEVLANVDAQNNPALRKARADWKDGLRNSPALIYDELICGDTNRLLHQAKMVSVDRSDLVQPAACPFRKLYPNILMMQSSQDRNGDNGARSLDCSMRGRIFL